MDNEPARLIGRYMRAGRQAAYHHVGDGPYAIRFKRDDGSAELAMVGFASLADAEAYAAFFEGNHAVGQPAPAPKPLTLAQLAGMVPVLDVRRIIAIEVVALVPAVSTSVLAHLKLDGAS